MSEEYSPEQTVFEAFATYMRRNYSAKSIEHVLTIFADADRFQRGNESLLTVFQSSGENGTLALRLLKSFLEFHPEATINLNAPISSTDAQFFKNALIQVYFALKSKS